MAFIVKRKLNKTTGSIALAISNVKDKIKRPFRRHKTAGHHETPHFRWPTFRKTEEEIKPPRMPIVRRAAHEAMLRITLSLIMARNKMSDAMTMLKCRTAQIGHHQHTAHKKVRAHRTEKRKAKAAPKKKIGIGWIATDRELLRIKIRSIADRIKYGRFM